MTKKVFVLGLGKSGQGAVRLLISKGFQVIAFDDHVESSKVQEFLTSIQSQSLSIAKNFEDLNSAIDLMVVSPGVPQEHPLYLKAKQLNIEIVGELELSLRLIKQKAIGITGTKGKTTLTLLLAEIFEKSRQGGKALGNIGEPLSDYLLMEFKEEVLCIEMSSFQLETVACRCLDAAIITNISPDHLDRYPHFDSYAEVKLSIQKILKNGAPLILPSDLYEQFSDKILQHTVCLYDHPKAHGQNMEYLHSKNSSDYETFLSSFSKEGPPKDCILIALEIAKIFKIPEEKFREALSCFKRPAHRMEYIETIQGIHFYNDSKATNVESVSYAVSTLNGPVILIAGGKDKGFGFEKWRDTLPAKVRKVIVFGQTAQKIFHTLHNFCDVEITSDLKSAVTLAFNVAKEHENVLLSPGCSSYDMFDDYVHRGECFRQMVLQIQKERSL